MNLPNPDRAVIARNKIEDYLLSPVHAVGRHKSTFFVLLGYAQSEWRILEHDLRKFAFRDALRAEETEYGTKYEIKGRLMGPEGVAAWGGLPPIYYSLSGGLTNDD